MPANYTHTAIAHGVTLTAATFNTDHENHITNRVVTKLGGYSTDVAEMQTLFNPGEFGVENLPASLADEIAAIRQGITDIKVNLPWYQTLTTRIDQLPIYPLFRHPGPGPSSVQEGLHWSLADTRKRLTWIVPSAYAGGDVLVTFWTQPDNFTAPTGTAVLRINRIISSAAEQEAFNVDQTYTSGQTQVRHVEATILEANVPAIGARLILDFQRLGSDAGDTCPVYISVLTATITYSAYAGRGL